jgi:hypothetical protein
MNGGEETGYSVRALDQRTNESSWMVMEPAGRQGASICDVCRFTNKQAAALALALVVQRHLQRLAVRVGAQLDVRVAAGQHAAQLDGVYCMALSERRHQLAGRRGTHRPLQLWQSQIHDHKGWCRAQVHPPPHVAPVHTFVCVRPSIVHYCVEFYAVE